MLGTIGDLVQDVVVWRQEELREGTDTQAEIAVQRGGSAANVAALAGPRYPTRFIGCVGDDIAGHALAAGLESCGVDVRLQVRDRTGTIVVLVDESGERTMFPSRGASARLGPVDPRWLDGLEVLHVTAYSFEYGSTPGAVLGAIEEVHRLGGRISMDVSSTGLIEHIGVADFLDLLGRCAPDIVSANRDEALLLGLADGPVPGPNLNLLQGATLLARAGAGATNVFVGGEHVVTVPVIPVADVLDLTGAGDAFMAGFLTDWLGRGWAPTRNVEAGHALARRVLRSPGAMEHDEPSG
jgi:sugar/nucleoside kinase (ribokinase family)